MNQLMKSPVLIGKCSSIEYNNTLTSKIFETFLGTS